MMIDSPLIKSSPLKARMMRLKPQVGSLILGDITHPSQFSPTAATLTKKCLDDLLPVRLRNISFDSLDESASEEINGQDDFPFILTGPVASTSSRQGQLKPRYHSYRKHNAFSPDRNVANTLVRSSCLNDDDEQQKLISLESVPLTPYVSQNVTLSPPRLYPTQTSYEVTSTSDISPSLYLPDF